MGDDAEWVGVDFEFGKANPPSTTLRPVTRRPVTRRTFTERPALPRYPSTTTRPHDAPEVERPLHNPTGGSNTVTIASSAVGGVLCLVLMLLLVYMLVLRRRLTKAKSARNDSQYQIRVEDVAHINIDEASNTYVNTTDLQKLLSSVRAKKKTEERPPTMPKIQHQTPTPYRSAPAPRPPSNDGQSDNSAFAPEPDVVILRAPMPVPHNKTDLHDFCSPDSRQPKAVQDSEVLYSNIEPVEPFKLSKPPARRKAGAPSTAPPAPPKNLRQIPVSQNNMEKNEEPISPVSPTVIARPAPPPPALAKTKSVETMDAPKTQKPLLPGVSKPILPVAPKPNKNESPAFTDFKSANTKPAPHVVSKPAPPPPSKPVPPATSKPAQQPTAKPAPPPTFKPAPPPTSKPTPPPNDKPAPPPSNKPTPVFKPAPPVAAKPGVAGKGKGLPPLKMALLPSLSKRSLDNCSTPDTGIIELTPENTPTPTGSISSKIAFLEGKIKTPVLPTRALPQKT